MATKRPPGIYVRHAGEQVKIACPFPRGFTHMRAEGWEPMSSCPAGVSFGKGYDQFLVAYEAFDDSGTFIVGQAVYIAAHSIPTTRSVEHQDDARRSVPPILRTPKQEEKEWPLHFLFPGYYVSFTTLVQHGGAGFNGASHKPAQVRVVPFAWRPLPVFR